MLLLASRSPQRREILRRLGISFRSVDPDADELAEGEPQALVLANARRKAARALDGLRAGEHLLAADTVVALDGRIFGKAASAAEAEAALRALAGRRHNVYGSLLLRGPDGHERTALCCTEVQMRAFDADLLQWYLATGEWRSRAGCYAIQGAGSALVRSIRGDYENIVGLSVTVLRELLPAGVWPPPARR